MASNKQAMINKLGSEEAYNQYLKKLSVKGGQVKVSKGKYGGKNKKFMT